MKNHITVANPSTSLSTEQQSLGEAYQALRDRLLTWLTSKVDNRAIAEDLLHDVFQKALIANQKHTPPQNINAWLFTISRNTLIDYYRSQRSMLALPDDLSLEEETDNASQQLAPCLLPMVKQLPTIYQEALIAVDFEGNTLQSVAAQQGLSLSAIKSRVSRARRLLRQSVLSCCHIDLSRSGSVEDFYQKSPACNC